MVSSVQGFKKWLKAGEANSGRRQTGMGNIRMAKSDGEIEALWR